ncbi:MFS transporter [Rhabdothermincola salaria]|uniref:MFS transporter n=1 Tax=Rhabdothermincola salaria TaxID=2903142 RepID=UPI001E537B64|nr:MFS transporter [Rhabdothermincola salaria]
MAVPRPQSEPFEEPDRGPDQMPLPGVADLAATLAEHPDTETHFPPSAQDRPGWHVRLFGSHEFFRLWLVQLISATGDWLAFSAIIVLATKVGGGAGAGAVSLVMAARIVPGFVFGPIAGVLVDRWDRKKVMVVCNLGRAVIVGLLPFVDSVLMLVVASLALEVMTLLWSPAKEAEVPNLVPHDHLTTANSLSLAAAYGTFPFASALFALLAGVSVWVGAIPGLAFLENNQMALAFYVDVLALLVAAWMISRLPLGGRRSSNRPLDAADAVQAERAVGAALKETLADLAEGWREIAANHTIRAVNLGLATGLIGGGMLIPLGAVFSTDVLDAGVAGYGVFTTALGVGVAVGAVGVSMLQKRLPQARVFTAALVFAGVALFAAASSSGLWVAAGFVALMGVCVGPVYVLGFSLLHQNVPDDLRGRVFSSLTTLVRLCVLISMVAGPLLAAVLGRLSEALVGGELDVLGLQLAVPGVRLALWLAAVIIVGAGLAAWASLRAGERASRAQSSAHPSGHGHR